MHWCCEQRSTSVDTRHKHPEPRLIKPDKREDCTSTGQAPDQGNRNARQDDQDVINYEFGVFVHSTHESKQVMEGLSTSVFMETCVKLQLQVR